MKIYKYLNPIAISKIFNSNEKVTLKCDYPKNFNDPYELFLTLDFNERPEMLAFYAEIIGEITQIPTTCFSRSPSIVPMWSHYAKNLQGFAIELDEEKLALHFSESIFEDVDYQDKPNDLIKNFLYRAYETQKGRHIYFLHQAVFNAAYFTKSKCWDYELERRMVIDTKETRNRNDLILIDIPLNCVSAIICGPRAKAETKKVLHEKAESINCGYYEMKIGRSTSTPFFIDPSGNPYLFLEGELSVPPNYCVNCKEPINVDGQQCSWCMIKESHRIDAAYRNTFRVYSQHGMLESYIDGMNKISRSHNKKGG